MRKECAWLAVAALFLCMVGTSTATMAAGGKEADIVATASDVMDKIMEIPESAIPPALLANAQGIAIIPDVIKVGLVVGAEYGRGILSIRGKGGAWSDPIFVTLTSGSVGWQIGAESTDFVIVFKNRRSVDGILKGKYTLGADLAAAAGPVGRRAGAATDVQLKAEIYTYSRNRGLFAGVSLEGSALQIDDKGNDAYYGRKEIRPSAILDGGGELRPPESAASLRKKLDTYAQPTGK